jgi:hypothetical protein
MTDPIALSKIYPTPPSVETTDKRYEETEMMVERHSVDLWDRQVSRRLWPQNHNHSG